MGDQVKVTSSFECAVLPNHRVYVLECGHLVWSMEPIDAFSCLACPGGW